MIESLSTNGAFANVMSRNSGLVFQPSPSSLIPDSFSKWSSGAFILESFDANSFRSFLESCWICFFSFSVTLWYVKFDFLSIVCFIFVVL